MRNWSVTVTAEAEQEIARLPRQVIADVLQMIEDLWEDPFPPGSLALRGYNGQFRLRTGTHRVLYQVNKRRRRQFWFGGSGREDRPTKECAIQSIDELGWVEGFEPSATGITIRRSTKLSYTHRTPLSLAKGVRY